QTLYLYKKTDGELQPEALQTTYFVPMTGHAEELRVNQADPANPEVVNGSFEETFGDGKLPAAWYYVRQAKVEEDGSAPAGGRRLTFANPVAGRPSKAVQAVGIDGKRVREIELSFSVRGSTQRPLQTVKQAAPGAFVEFYDKDRKKIGDGGQETWLEESGWEKQKVLIKVPPAAMLGVLWIGLGEAAGDISFDDVRLKATIVK
ncbi:MAG: protein-L-isoaspartate(D-aspartate) O-methyltransferase, partial [Pirellulales bacterium]